MPQKLPRHPEDSIPWIEGIVDSKDENEDGVKSPNHTAPYCQRDLLHCELAPIPAVAMPALLLIAHGKETKRGIAKTLARGHRNSTHRW